ncbi:MAG: hypothetical protein HY859_08890 [Caulobacterales bacterium]|nr:hypothetical protein [Caulobacterales bacterium]
MRVLLILCVLLLGACNRVYTDEPLFAPDTGPNAPQLREGVWLTDYNLMVTPADLLSGAFMKDRKKEEDLACPFDEAKPAKSWWPCANWTLMTDREVRSWRVDISEADIRRMHRGDLSPPKGGHWSAYGFVLADGEPMILQLAVPVKDVWGDESALDDEGHPLMQFAYFGVEVTRRGADGRIEAMRTWPILCGPPPPRPEPTPNSTDPNAGGGPRPQGTLAPFPGIEMEEGDVCTTNSIAVLRSAAAASRSFAEGEGAARWVPGARP